MRLPKLVPGLGAKAHAHGRDFYCANPSDIEQSTLESIGTYAEVLPRRRETGWYADSSGNEILTGRIYAYGRKHLPDGYGGLDWYGDYYTFVAAVESNDADLVWLIAERFTNQEDAAEAAHDFARCLAEVAHEADLAYREAFRARTTLVGANDRRRAAIQLIREHDGLENVPGAIRALIEREWAAAADERQRIFRHIEDQQPGSWSPEHVQESWRDGWRAV